MSSMQICATTCRNAVQGKTAFWLQDLGRSGEVPVRRRSSVLKRLPRRPCLRILLATFLLRSVESPQVIAPFQPTRRRNLGLTRALARLSRLSGGRSALRSHNPGCTIAGALRGRRARWLLTWPGPDPAGRQRPGGGGTRPAAAECGEVMLAQACGSGLVHPPGIEWARVPERVMPAQRIGTRRLVADPVGVAPPERGEAGVEVAWHAADRAHPKVSGEQPG